MPEYLTREDFEMSRASDTPSLPTVYAVDFDGFLCRNAYPAIGEPRVDVIEHFKQLKANGAKLILWTCREDKLLLDAILWCAKYGLLFDAYNDSLPEWKTKYNTNPRKVGADYYCDDKNYMFGVNANG